MKKLYPVYVNRKSPCYSKDHLGNTGCPAKNDIPKFLHLVSLRRFEEAFYLLKETNPFSAGCGRFCDHPCETACNRAKFDMPVDIKALERFVADWGYKKGLKPKNVKTKNDKQVAVIGSGPGGLSAAYFLAKEGVKVDVYEKHSKPGGLLVEGIPVYRYPREIFQKELQYIIDTGVNIYCDENVNKEKFLKLVKEYDAVIVATGAHKPGVMGIEGEDLGKVYNGIQFLRDVNFDNVENLKLKKGESIGIIGGGYTAFDVARVSVRLGAKPTVIYRRTVSEMTAHPGEVEESKREGVDFKFLLQPVSIKRKNEKLILKCQKMKLGPVDESGRRRPVPVKDVYEEFEFDRIVVAVGDKPDFYFVGESFSIEFPRLICHDLPVELKDKVYITGDAAMGAVENTGMVVRAVGLARETARAVLKNLGIDVAEEPEREIAFFDTLNVKYFDKSSRLVEEKLDFGERKESFREIVKTIDEDMAVLFAKRCFFCGICIQCDWCYRYAGGSIVKHITEWSLEKDACFYHFLEEKMGSATFKSVEACPRAALSVIEEGSPKIDYVEKQYTNLKKLLGVSDVEKK
ncbi:FAD-binding protein [Deferribacter autotrophicus]|uniref:FAD-binding protein n=1 Tax=Deferribacter autotrophicus TaxID=500465 RepID=A0A5A8F6R1_9BACT|nr:FAD-dependent oxidoreductase [Deferribacter autotrophicus]KAA0259168.1 FAD-binding protein [Deferribacter autotrophicus]